VEPLGQFILSTGLLGLCDINDQLNHEGDNCQRKRRSGQGVSSVY